MGYETTIANILNESTKNTSKGIQSRRNIILTEIYEKAYTDDPVIPRRTGQITKQY